MSDTRAQGDPTPAEQDLMDFLVTLEESEVKTLLMFCMNFLSTASVVEGLDAALSSEQKRICSQLWVTERA